MRMHVILLSPSPALFLALFLSCSAHAADTTETLKQTRTRSGVWAGIGVVTGRLELRSRTAALGTRVDALPAATFGAEYWNGDRVGVYLSGAIGAGADLDVPPAQTLRYNMHQFEAGGRLRWHFGPRADALAVFVGAGLRWTHQDIQSQRPILFVDTTLAGPELSIGLEWPVLGDRLWVRASARAGVPLFVRESPADSGNPKTFAAIGARAEVFVQVVGAWSAALAVDYADNEVTFSGQGTRASGVVGSETRDRFTTFFAVGRYTL